MPKIAIIIEYDTPDDPLWLNPDNVSLALHAYCKNTKFKVGWAKGGNPWVGLETMHPHPEKCPKCGSDEVYYERFTEHPGGTYACHSGGDCGWTMPARINQEMWEQVSGDTVDKHFPIFKIIRKGPTKEARETMVDIINMVGQTVENGYGDCKLCGERFYGNFGEVLEQLGNHGEEKHQDHFRDISSADE